MFWCLAGPGVGWPPSGRDRNAEERPGTNPQGPRAHAAAARAQQHADPRRGRRRARARPPRPQRAADPRRSVPRLPVLPDRLERAEHDEGVYPGVRHPNFRDASGDEDDDDEDSWSDEPDGSCRGCGAYALSGLLCDGCRSRGWTDGPQGGTPGPTTTTPATSRRSGSAWSAAPACPARTTNAPATKTTAGRKTPSRLTPKRSDHRDGRRSGGSGAGPGPVPAA